jgi:hypothetical protein
MKRFFPIVIVLALLPTASYAGDILPAGTWRTADGSAVVKRNGSKFVITDAEDSNVRAFGDISGSCTFQIVNENIETPCRFKAGGSGLVVFTVPAMNLTYQLRHSTSQQRTAASSAAKSSSGPWASYMSNRHIARYYNGSGYQEEEHLYLYSNGTFSRSFNSGGYGGGASGASGGSNRGTWSAYGPENNGTLVLRSANGQQSSFSLSVSDGLYLDNTKWTRAGTAQ